MPDTNSSSEKKAERVLYIQAVLAPVLGLAALLIGELIAGRWRGTGFVVTITRIFSLAAFLYGGLCVMLLRGFFPAAARVLRIVWIAVAVLMIISFVVIEIIIFTGDKSDFDGPENTPSRYMIILGAGIQGTTPSLVLASRLDAALPYLLELPDLVCVLSGGQGEGEDITEAQAMYNYLTERGVPPQQLLMEGASVNTAQNVTKSLEILGAYERAQGRDGIEGRGVIVCSSGYHLFRARYLLRRSGVTPYALDAPLPRRYLVLTGYFREYFSVLFMWRRE